MTQVNWFENITTIVKSKPGVRNTFLMIGIILYFGFRDYKQSQESDKVNQRFEKVADAANIRADKAEERVERLIDKAINEAEKRTDFRDSILTTLKRLETKLPRE